MVLKLYKIEGSPPVRAVLMTIDILGLNNVEYEEVNLMLGEHHKPEYIAKNPLRTVPLLEEDDFILPESHAIITYLVSKYGAEKRATYYPTDLRVRATVDQRLYFNATRLHPCLIGVVRPVFMGLSKGPSDEQVAAIYEAYGIAEKYLEKSTFIAGEHITIADLSCVATISSLNVIAPIRDFPKLKEWLAKLEAQEWYQRSNVPGLNKISSFYMQKIEEAK